MAKRATYQRRTAGRIRDLEEENESLQNQVDSVADIVCARRGRRKTTRTAKTATMRTSKRRSSLVSAKRARQGAIVVAICPRVFGVVWSVQSDAVCPPGWVRFVTLCLHSLRCSLAGHHGQRGCSAIGGFKPHRQAHDRGMAHSQPFAQAAAICALWPTAFARSWAARSLSIRDRARGHHPCWQNRREAGRRASGT